MTPIIRVRKDRIDVVGTIGIQANVQGETGLALPGEVIREAVASYKKLIEVAPYYRFMLDSHIDMRKAQWANVVGMITNVECAEDGSAIIDYTIFGDTRAYTTVAIMVKAGLPGAVSVSTRGFGKSQALTTAQLPSRVKITRTLAGSPVKFWKYLGTSLYKNRITLMEDFILLGWDLVVAPSQVETGLHILSSAPSVVGESSAGVYEKLIGNRTDLQSIASEGLDKIIDGYLRPIGESAGPLPSLDIPLTPPLRLGLVDDGGKIAREFGSIEDILRSVKQVN